ncbi:MAG: lipoyl(octanoyl) transferase LipB [Hyphomicrobiaceae bacterium]
MSASIGPSPADKGAASPPVRPVDWRVDGEPSGYDEAVAFMETRAAAIADGTAGELVWLTGHLPLYTAGTSARDADLLDPARFPVHRSGRGGQYTYHGPGQRVGYVMLDLKRRSPPGHGPDIRAYVTGLERWLIATLARLGVAALCRRERVGVWVPRPDKGPDAEDKIAAIGVRVRRGVTMHGFALNVAPDLGHFAGIVPCGLSGFGVTSLADLGIDATMADVDRALAATFPAVFGPITGPA